MDKKQQFCTICGRVIETSKEDLKDNDMVSADNFIEVCDKCYAALKERIDMLRKN